MGNNKDKKNVKGTNNSDTRGDKSSTSSGQRKRLNRTIIYIVVISVIGVAIALSLFLYGMPGQQSSASALAIDGISCDSKEHTVYHTHAHMDMFIGGQPYEVPARIGIEPSSNCLFWLHTHSGDGIIHMESPENRIMTLGNLLDIWQTTASHVDQFAKPPMANNGSPSVYVNGDKVITHTNEDYRDAKIFPNTEIAVVYGSPPSKIPSSYVFGKTDIKIDGGNTDIIRQILTPSTSGSGPLGDVNAPVTIVEFGDYQCNSCGIFHRETKDAVMTNLVNSGKAKFLFRDFTLNDYILQPPKGSTLAAEAAYCAGDQGKFWQYHDELYKNQKQEGVVWISEDSLTGFASNIGIGDMQQFSNCLDSHEHASTVKANNDLVVKLGLNATPTFIIIPSFEGVNPVKLVGAYPYQSFEAVINQLASSS